MEGAFERAGTTGQQISGSHTEGKNDMNPAVLFSFFSLSPALSFFPPVFLIPFFIFAGNGKGSLSAETHCSFDLGDQDKSKQK